MELPLQIKRIDVDVDLISSVKEHQVDTFSLGYLHCESVEKYGIIQVLTRQLGNEPMNYISTMKVEKNFSL